MAAAFGVLALLAAGSAAYWFYFMRGTVFSDDARIDGNLVDAAPQLGGLLTDVAVREGDSVSRDQLLFKLDARALQAALDRAKAEVSAAEARLQVSEADYQKAVHGPLPAEIRIAVSAKESADAQAALAQSDRDRAEHLYEEHVETEADKMKAETALKNAKSAQQAAADRLKLLIHGTRNEDLAVAHADVGRSEADLAAARAALSQAEINLGHAEVKSPFDGIVVRKWRDPGATVNPGTAVLTLLDPSTLDVSANIDEKDLAEVAIGDPVDIEVDAYPGRKLVGRVKRILRATNSKFGLIPSEGVSGTFIKVAQRVPLRISIDAPPRDMHLSPGLSVEISIHVNGMGGTQAAAVSSSQ